MADREKVSKGLECVICPNRLCGDCLYFIRDENDPCTGWCNRDAIYKDALSLLKAQEPRLMTLEEIPEHDGAFLIEYRHEVWPMQWALFRLKLTTAYRFIRGDSELGFSISKDFYGKTWRCWTSRPTDEQRKKVKWDDESRSD